MPVVKTFASLLQLPDVCRNLKDGATQLHIGLQTETDGHRKRESVNYLGFMRNRFCVMKG